MKIFSLGIAQLTINELKLAGFTVITQNVLPEPAHAAGHLLLVTSEQVPVSALSGLRSSFVQSTILYLYLQRESAAIRLFICSARVWESCSFPRVQQLRPLLKSCGTSWRRSMRNGAAW